MSHPTEEILKTLQFYSTAEYECGYLPQRSARSLVAAPAHLIDAKIYSKLIAQGFRRSGLFTYKPNCFGCNACISMRIPVKQFKISRSQKRVLKMNSNLRHRVLDLSFFDEHLRLYRHYQHARHDGIDITDDIEKQYKNFLISSAVDSKLIEYRNQYGELKIVSLIDIIDNGLSAVYTFFDSNSKNSLGTYSILSQIEICNRLDLDWLYMGYLIKDCPKMAYKSNFKPYQILKKGLWLDVA